MTTFDPRTQVFKQDTSPNNLHRFQGASGYLHVPTRSVRAVLARKPGQLFTSREIREALKIPEKPDDNRTAVVEALCRAVERGQIEADWKDVDGVRTQAWRAPQPKGYEQ